MQHVCYIPPHSHLMVLEWTKHLPTNNASIMHVEWVVTKLLLHQAVEPCNHADGDPKLTNYSMSEKKKEKKKKHGKKRHIWHSVGFLIYEQNHKVLGT